jgi:excisionase family DNA binding protein
MTDLLTAKDMEELLHVDRSTIYRMAEQGRLPAVKVGKQWRFPSDQVSSQFQIQVPSPVDNSENSKPAIVATNTDKLAAVLPIECVQLIQESFADLLGVMIVVTDMEGRPITNPSNSCGLFDVISQVPGALQKCIQSWHIMASSLELEPQFDISHLGLHCARALIRVGSELQGMVVASCVAPDTWPPKEEGISAIAAELAVDQALIEKHVEEVHRLSAYQQEQVLVYIQRMANIVAHIVNERITLVNRLEAIADLTAL